MIKDYISPDSILRKENNNLNLVISSMKFVNNLKSHGIVERKSYEHFHIPLINKNLVRHFIRGYFDGDGSVYKDRNSLRVSICSITDTILLDIQKVLSLNGIESKINIEKRENKAFKVPTGYSSNCKNMCRLYIRKKNSLKLLFEFLYKDSQIHLNRKFNIFQSHINTEVNN